jgi:hypothetical protein
MSENWNEILQNEPIDEMPRPGFEAELRAGLIDEWNGRPTITPADGPQSADRATRRGWLLGAAAASVLLIGGVVIATRTGSDSTVQTPANNPIPSPSAGPALATDAVVNPNPETTEDPTATAVVVPGDSRVGSEAQAGELNANGETVDSCASLAPMVEVTSAETPFSIRSGLTSSGGTWISVDDATDRRVASVCQDSEALLAGAIEAQLAWPIGDDVFVASIDPDASEQDPVPAWFNSIGSYSLVPMRSIADIGRIAPEIVLPEVPDVQSEGAERERQLIDKIEQVRDLRNFVSSIDVVNADSAPSLLDSAGGIEGPLMYWRERPEGERESETALIEGVLVQEGDCLFVGEGDSRSVVLWEYGTRWLGDQLAVLLPDGTTIPVGSRIQGSGGGYHAVDQLSFFTSSDAVSARAEQCAGPNGEVAVVQS